jgi:hypothetical protein
MKAIAKLCAESLNEYKEFKNDLPSKDKILLDPETTEVIFSALGQAWKELGAKSQVTEITKLLSAIMDFGDVSDEMIEKYFPG